MTRSESSINDAPRNESNGQFTDRHNENHWHVPQKSGDPIPPKNDLGESPLDSNYLEQPIGSTPNWDFPKTKEQAILMVNQMHSFMNYANIKNPNIKCLLDLMDYHESLEIELHKMKLERSASLEYELTQEGQEGLILGDEQPFDESKTNIELIDGIWYPKGLHLLTAPPGYGKTLSIFHLIKRLDLSGRAVLYCGRDETEAGVTQKLKSLGYSNWKISRLTDGLSQDHAWESIHIWESLTREHEVRFLILDLLLHYVNYKISQPDSIISELSRVTDFSNKNNIIVVGLCHSSLGSIAPTGHQSLVGCSQRLLILKETADNNTVQIDISRRGPHHSITFSHDWINISKAKELLERGKLASPPTNSNVEPKKTKIELAIEWLTDNPEYINESASKVKQIADYDPLGPISIGRDSWWKALKQLKEEEGNKYVLEESEPLNYQSVN